MTKHSFVRIATLLAATLSFTACHDNGSSLAPFTAAEVLGAKYNIVLGAGVDLDLVYHSGTPLQTSNLFTWMDYIGMPAPDYAKLDVDFDSTNQLFIVNVLDAANATVAAFFVPTDRVNVKLKNGTVLHQFSSSLTDIVSIDFVIDAGSPSTTTYGNCEMRLTRALTISITAAEMSLTVHGQKQWVDMAATSPGPLARCSDQLNLEKTYLQTMNPLADGDLKITYTKGFLDLIRITELDLLAVEIVLAGPNANPSEEIGSDAGVSAPSASLQTIDLGDGAFGQVRDANSLSL